MKNVTILFLFLLTALLAGCMPTYQVKDPSKTILFNVKDMPRPEICVNGKFYTLRKDKNGMTRIPYGKRIIIASDFSISEDQGIMTRTDSCRPVVSFIPKAGEKYMATFHIQSKTCFLSILRLDPFLKAGFEPVYSMRRAQCGR